MPQEKFTLPTIDIFFYRLLQLLTGLHGFQTLADFEHNPLQKLFKIPDLQDLLFRFNLQIELGCDQITDMKRVIQGMQGESQLFWQFRQLHKPGKLGAQAENHGLPLRTFIPGHKNFPYGGPVERGRLNNLYYFNFFGTTDHNMVISLFFFAEFMDIANNPDPIQIIFCKMVNAFRHCFSGGDKPDYPVAQKSVINKLLGRLISHLQGKAHSRIKDKTTKR